VRQVAVELPRAEVLTLGFPVRLVRILENSFMHKGLKMGRAHENSSLRSAIWS
jgi:hypothetical protein